jgi:hypothetical protein
MESRCYDVLKATSLKGFHQTVDLKIIEIFGLKCNKTLIVSNSEDGRILKILPKQSS